MEILIWNSICNFCHLNKKFKLPVFSMSHFLNGTMAVNALWHYMWQWGDIIKAYGLSIISHPLRWRPVSVNTALVTWLLPVAQQFVQADIKGNTRGPFCWPFVRGIRLSPVDSPRKGPVMRKAFPWHNVIIKDIWCIALLHTFVSRKQLILWFVILTINQ